VGLKLTATLQLDPAPTVWPLQPSLVMAKSAVLLPAIETPLIVIAPEPVLETVMPCDCDVEWRFSAPKSSVAGLTLALGVGAGWTVTLSCCSAVPPASPVAVTVNA
jgi:hypothetical protein